MNAEYIELDLMVAELETENRMIRARNERLEKELAAVTTERDAIKDAMERILAISKLAVWDGKLEGVSQVVQAKQTTSTGSRTRAFLGEEND
jgi:predicted  nucleic acid-binding Zn-ribbon protein